MSDVRFFDLRISAPKRLALMRAAFDFHAKKYPHCPEQMRPKSWRDVRRYRLSNWRDAFCAGLHSGIDQWYTHNGPQFRGEAFADSFEGGPNHKGWFADCDGDEVARGIVGRLTHGRFIAGYEWSSNGERVYYPKVFDSERDAARMADEHARVFAESARDDDERFRAMQHAESHAEAVAEDVKNAFEVRNASEYWRKHCRERIEELKAARRDLANKTRAYENGGK